MKYRIHILVAAIAIIAFFAREQLQTRLRPFIGIFSGKGTPNQTSIRPLMAATKNSSFVGLPVIPPNDPSLNATSPIPRKIQKVFLAREQAEGAGATVRRSVGTPQLRNFSPFLMLDEFSISIGAGFPDHPHRGQETITYLLKGSVDHEDFSGAKGRIETGDLQFMTAGRGIVHAEMPAPPDPERNSDGVNVGLQLWVDLPEHLKACEPRYRDLKAAEIPQARSEDGKVNVKVISGRAYGVDSLQELAYTPVWLLDVTLSPGGKFEQNLPKGWNAFIYTLKGTTTIGSEPDARVVEAHHNAVLEQAGDALVAQNDAGAAGESRFVLVAGLPLQQKVFQYGPFVLSKQEDVYKAMSDYSMFANGFERAKDWASEIGKTMVH